MKLNLYTSKSGGEVPEQPRQLDLATVGAPYQAVAAAAQTVGQEAQAWGTQLQREEAAKGEVESSNFQSKFDRALVDEDIKMQRDPKFDPNEHDKRLDEAGQKLIEKYAGEMKSRTGSQHFRKAAGRTLKEKVINAKYAAKVRLDEAAEGANIDANNREAVKIADTDPSLRAARLDAQKTINTEWGQRYNKVKEAEARTRKLYEDVDVVLARRSMKADPDAFLVELDEKDPDTGKPMYENLSATKRQELQEQAVKLSEARSKTNDKIRTEYSGALKKHLIDRMDSGVNADAEIRALRDSLTDEDYNHALERNKKIYNPDSGSFVTDRPTYFSLDLGIREGRIKTHQQIDEWKDSLSVPDYRVLGNMLDDKLRPPAERKSEAERVRDKQVEAAETRIKGIFRTSMGNTGVDFEQETTIATTEALAEFQSRVAVEKDAHPMELQNEIVMRWAKGLTDKLYDRDPARVKAALRFHDEDALKAARTSMSSAEYITQKNLFDYWVYLSRIASGKAVPPGLGAPSGRAPGAGGAPAAPTTPKPASPASPGRFPAATGGIGGPSRKTR